MNHVITRFLPVCLLATFASAQTAYVLTRDPGTGLRPAIAVRLPGPVVPAMMQYWERPELTNYYAGSIVGTGTPTAPLAHEGGFAIDQEARLVYATDGTSFLSQDAHSTYGTVATAPTASLPLTGWTHGPLTGLAVTPGGLLFICGITMCQARSKTYPYAAAGAPFPMPPFPGTPGATGLDYDPSSGTLWACNVAGATVNFTLTGAPIAAFPAPPVPGLAPVRGLAVNPMAGPLAMPPLVPQTPGFHICLTNGSLICDALPPFGTIPFATSFPTHCRGLAISSDPVLLPGRYNTVGGYHVYNSDPLFSAFYPQNRLSRPTNTNAASPCLLKLDGAPASSTAILVAALMPVAPAGGGIVVGTDVLWVNPFGPYYLAGPVAVDAAGHAELTIPGGLPVGFHMITQWAVPDAAAYLGFRFTDALLFRFGLQ